MIVGTLSSEGSGLFRVTTSATVDSLTLDGTPLIGNGIDMNIAGTLLNQGEIQLNGVQATTRAFLISDVTLSGTGTPKCSARRSGRAHFRMTASPRSREDGRRKESGRSRVVPRQARSTPRRKGTADRRQRAF